MSLKFVLKATSTSNLNIFDACEALSRIFGTDVVTHFTNTTRYAQRPQTSADPEDPDFGLWTPGSKA